MRAINLKTNHLTAPLGMDAGPLFLSWQCVDGVRQTAYEIELTANGETVWHSGKVQSAAVHADAPTVGGSRVRGCWRVRLWDENDTPGAWSEAHFETGLAQSDWQGEWVDPETEEIDIPGDDAINAFARPNWERKQAEEEAAGKGAAESYKPHRPASYLRKTLKRIVVFFAVMLILTLVARGTSSAIRPVVTTQQAKAGTISQSVQSSGSITASSVLSVSLPEGIVLDNILVKEGQSVVEGQTLATCDVDELSTKLDRAKASLQKSKAEYNQLLSNAVLDDTSVARTQQALLRAYEADQKAYEELEKLRASENPDPEAISTAEQAADDAHWAAQQAEYDRNSALASYQEMQRQNNLSAQVNQASAEDVALDIKDTQAEIEQLEQLVNQQGVISSPFSGVISNVEAEVGTESTQTFCTIYDTSKGYLFACELPAAQASDCQTGLSAVIKQGDQTETAAITAISENAENDTVDITIQLTATDWKVGPADAEIVLSEQDYDLCLPNTAIHQDNQGDFVFAVEEKNTVLGTQNVLVRIPVTVLEVGQSQTSIEGAISPEDSIVVQSTRSLEAGSKVRVKNENA